MRFTSTSAGVVSALALASSASARLVGIQAPSTITPGQDFTVSLITENYIQSVADVAVAFGISAAPGYPGSLGQTIASEYLGPNSSNVRNNLNYTVSLPANYAKGQATLGAELFSLYGASSSGVISNFNVTVTISDTTSTETVSSSGIN